MKNTTISAQAVSAWLHLNKAGRAIVCSLAFSLTSLVSHASFSYWGSPTVVITSGKVAEAALWTGWDWVLNPFASVTIWASSDLQFEYTNGHLSGFTATGVNLTVGGIGYRFTWDAVPVGWGNNLDISLHFQHNLIFENHYTAANVIMGVPYHSFPDIGFYNLYKNAVGHVVDTDYYHDLMDLPNAFMLGLELERLFTNNRTAFNELIDSSPMLAIGAYGNLSEPNVHITTSDIYDLADVCSAWWLTWDW